MPVPDPRDDDADADERAWQAIVDNYGDRPEIDESPTTSAPGGPFGGRFGDPDAISRRVENPVEDPRDSLDDDLDDDLEDDEDEGYEPPPPPPLPRVAPDRGLAWAGVFGSPAVLLAALVLSISIPTWLGYLLIIGFVGGFVYLVVTMPREPRDPFDDGAQV